MEHDSKGKIPTLTELIKEWCDIDEMDDGGNEDIVYARLANFYDHARKLTPEEAKKLADIIQPEEKL